MKLNIFMNLHIRKILLMK